MQRLPNVVLAQGDAAVAAKLASALHGHCRTVYLARTPDEIRNAVPKHRADVVIVDLEVLGLRDVQKLHDDFGGVLIVTTHRVADEELWARSLEAGAVDCCYSNDLTGILGATLSLAGTKPQAA